MITAVLPFAIFFEGQLITSPSLSSPEDKAQFLSVVNAVLVGALMVLLIN